MEIILNYFPSLSDKQKEQFAILQGLYETWNEKINVISRKDIHELYLRHVLHSLAIAKVIEFKPMTTLLDIGTGGGFPGIPLAIMFPECRFVLSDSIGKKITVVKGVKEALELNNVEAVNQRAETIEERFDFITCRAVTRLIELTNWSKGSISKSNFNNLANGIIGLKGGDLSEEIKEVGKPVKTWDISTFFKEDFFETKKVFHLALKG